MAHKLRIELRYSEPKIYRTVIVPENYTFYDLHIVIQCVMNWGNCHLFQFNLGQPYASDCITELEHEDDFMGMRYNKYEAEETQLSEFFNGQKKKMNYVYDYGEDWVHTITVNKKPNEEVLYSKCIKGENAAPIDDIGGLGGFYSLIELMNKTRKSEEEREMLEWYGLPKTKRYEDVFGFDIELANARLLNTFKPISME